MAKTFAQNYCYKFAPHVTPASRIGKSAPIKVTICTPNSSSSNKTFSIKSSSTSITDAKSTSTETTKTSGTVATFSDDRKASNETPKTSKAMLIDARSTTTETLKSSRTVATSSDARTTSKLNGSETPRSHIPVACVYQVTSASHIRPKSSLFQGTRPVISLVSSTKQQTRSSRTSEKPDP